MKRFIKLSMCFLIMLGASGIQGVSAEGVTAYTGDAEQESELSEHELSISTGQESSDGISTMTFDGGNLFIKTPNKIVPLDYKVVFSASNPDLFRKDSVENVYFDEVEGFLKCREKNEGGLLTRLVPVKEGMSTINIKLIDPYLHSGYK